MASFSDEELERYARHIIMREVGGLGQKRLKAARVLMVGAGGLGAPAILYLAAAGVGRLGIVDDDVVSLSNLQRQVIHLTTWIGAPKVESAENMVRALNPNVEVVGHNTRLTQENAEAIIADYDIVLDGSDNFDTRYMVNEVVTRLGKTLVSAAISQWEGQISVFAPGAPCYACVFPERPADGLAPSCAESGVIGPMAGVLGCMAATEAVKVITGAGKPLTGRLMIYDALDADVRVFHTDKRDGCTVCGG
jgi:molybdopterin/thiamine biosynthesis adenylyltransferase